MAGNLSLGKLVIPLIVLIVIVAAVAYALSGGTPTISSNRSVTISQNASFDFYLPSNKNISAIFVESSANGSAVIYLGRVPILSNPVSVVSLSTSKPVNVSTNSSGYADLQVTLTSSTSKAATLELSPISSSLYIRTSPGISLLTGQPTQQTTTIPATTTISSGQTTTVASTTTAAATTTVSSNPLQQAIEIANTTDTGSLMVRYNTLYQYEATACTESIYDQDFAKAFGTLPSGPTTFANTSSETPHSISIAVKQLSPDIFNLTYTAVAPAGNSKLLQLQLNSSGQFIVTYSFEGYFAGLNYDDALEQYQAINVSTDPCSAYV